MAPEPRRRACDVSITFTQKPEVQRHAAVHSNILPKVELCVIPALYLTLERLKAEVCMIF